MVESLFDRSELAAALVTIGATTALGLLTYLVSAWLVHRSQAANLKEPTSSLFRVVGMIVGLMLSLAFADVVLQVKEIENAVQREAAAIKRLHGDLMSFGVEETGNSRASLIAYTQSIIEDEWRELADDRLSDRTEDLHTALSREVMSLEPATKLQEILWGRILANVSALTDHRLDRLESALAKPPAFIYVVMLGFIVTMACFGAYRPQASIIALLGMYTLYIGFVLYLVLAMSDPFQGATSVDPTVLERLVVKLQSIQG